MKIKRIKLPRCFPFLRFELRKAGFKFKSEIYEDDSGYYEMSEKGIQLHCKESATLNDWIEDIENKMSELDNLRDFLKEVEYQRRQPENKL